jgi:hypothetical protein
MIRLSAFADEISADLNEQIEVLHSERIHFIDLRGVWGINVLWPENSRGSADHNFFTRLRNLFNDYYSRLIGNLHS